MIPVYGVGREVIPDDRQAAKTAIDALGSDIPKPVFIDLLAGWGYFTRPGTALPEETPSLEYVFPSQK